MLADCDAFIDGPYPIVGANASAAEVEQLMRDNLLPPKTSISRASRRWSSTPASELVLFDTGNGANGFVRGRTAAGSRRSSASAGFKPEEIDVVVLSHGHPDHVGGVMEGGKPLFPNARYVIAGIEYDFWAPEGKHSGEMEKLAALFRANVVPVAERITFIKAGDEVVPGIRALEAYGHTPGHLAFTSRATASACCSGATARIITSPRWRGPTGIASSMSTRSRARRRASASTTWRRPSASR